MRPWLGCAVGLPAAVLDAHPAALTAFLWSCLAHSLQQRWVMQGHCPQGGWLGTRPGGRLLLRDQDIAAACPKDRVTAASPSLLQFVTPACCSISVGSSFPVLALPSPLHSQEPWRCHQTGQHALPDRTQFRWTGRKTVTFQSAFEKK